MAPPRKIDSVLKNRILQLNRVTTSPEVAGSLHVMAAKNGKMSGSYGFSENFELAMSESDGNDKVVLKNTFFQRLYRKTSQKLGFGREKTSKLPTPKTTTFQLLKIHRLRNGYFQNRKWVFSNDDFDIFKMIVKVIKKSFRESRCKYTFFRLISSLNTKLFLTFNFFKQVR